MNKEKYRIYLFIFFNFFKGIKNSVDFWNKKNFDCFVKNKKNLLTKEQIQLLTNKQLSLLIEEKKENFLNEKQIKFLRPVQINFLKKLKLNIKSQNKNFNVINKQFKKAMRKQKVFLLDKIKQRRAILERRRFYCNEQNNFFLSRYKQKKIKKQRELKFLAAIWLGNGYV